MPAQDIYTTGFLSAGLGSTHPAAGGKSFTLFIPLPVPTIANADMPSSFRILTKQLINNLTATTGLQLERGQDFPRGDGNL